MAPVGDTGVLPSSLVESARTGPTLQSFAEIQGMKDQGGGRRKKSRRGKKSKKSKRSRRHRKGMRGGWSPVDSDTMLLPVGMEQGAVSGMNPEWKLAENPASFNPN